MTKIPKRFEIKTKYSSSGVQTRHLYFDGEPFPYGTMPGSLKVEPHPDSAQYSIVTVSILVDGPIKIGEVIEGQ